MRQSNMRSIRGWVAAVMAAVSLSSAAWAQAQTLKVGALNPYSGPLALYGTEVTRGYEIAADKVNAEGGVLGRQIELLRGDVTTPQQGIATVEQLVTRDKVDLFVGTYISAIALTASDAAARYDKLYWETNALAQQLTERGLPNFIRVGPSSVDLATTSSEATRDVVAPALNKDVKDLRVWIESEDSIYGTSIAQEQKRLLESYGAQIVGVGAHSVRAIDLNDTVLRMKQAMPDLILSTGYVPDGNLLLRTLREQEVKPGALMFAGTGDTPETLQAIGADYLEGILIVSYPRFDVQDTFGPGNKDYLNAYRAKYNAEPIAPQGMTGYSGFLALVETLKAAGDTAPDKVRAAAAQLDQPLYTYPTGFGVKFDQNFQNSRTPFIVAQWQNGEMVTVYPSAAVLPGVKLLPLGRK